MKAFAKEFYEGRAWRECRKNYLITQRNICERCGGIAKIVHHKVKLTPKNISDPYISLNYTNLEALCQMCHNMEHNKGKAKAEARYMFDEYGNIIAIPPIENNRNNHQITECEP